MLALLLWVLKFVHLDIFIFQIFDLTHEQLHEFCLLVLQDFVIVVDHDWLENEFIESAEAALTAVELLPLSVEVACSVFVLLTDFFG